MTLPQKFQTLSHYLTRRHPLHLLEETKDPYAVGVAVILSGNTTDAAVNRVIHGFLAVYPTPQAALTGNRDSMIPLLPGIAHNGSKSDYIQNWSRYLIERQGNIETTVEALTKVTGIGRKTAGIILYRVLGLDVGFPLDTHCLRVLERLGWFQSHKAPSLERELLAVIPEGHRHATHLILTHHGREVCHALKPQCASCTLSASCSWYDNNGPKS